MPVPMPLSVECQKNMYGEMLKIKPRNSDIPGHTRTSLDKPLIHRNLAIFGIWQFAKLFVSLCRDWFSGLPSRKSIHLLYHALSMWTVSRQTNLPGMFLTILHPNYIKVCLESFRTIQNVDWLERFVPEWQYNAPLIYGGNIFERNITGEPPTYGYTALWLYGWQPPLNPNQKLLWQTNPSSPGSCSRCPPDSGGRSPQRDKIAVNPAHIIEPPWDRFGITARFPCQVIRWRPPLCSHHYIQTQF